MVDSKDPVQPKETLPAPSEQQKTLAALSAGKTVIGVEIGSSSINVAQTAVYKGKPTLIRVEVEEIDLANEREWDRATSEALRRVLARFDTKKAEIVCAVPSRQTIVERLLMPVMPFDELADAVRLEVGHSDRFAIENPVIDFQVLGKASEKGAEKLKVMVAVSSSAAIEGLLAKFPPKTRVNSIIPLPVAIENLIRKAKVGMDETVAVIEMGSIATELNIYKNSQLESSRQIPFAAFHLTRALTGSFFAPGGAKVELTVEEAEKIKRDHGIPMANDGYLIEGKITAAQALVLLRPKLELLVVEIYRSLDYYRTKMNGGKVDQILLIGGGARLKGLVGFLIDELGIPVKLGDPLEFVEVFSEEVVSKSGDAQKLVQAIGAAFEDLQGINLLPLNLKERSKRSFERILLGGLVAASAALLIAAYAGLMFRVSDVRKDAAVAVSSYEAMVPQLKQLKSGLRLQKTIRLRPDLGVLCKQLSYLPEGVYLTEVKLKGRKVNISGFTTAQVRKPDDAVDQVITDLQRGALKSAKLMGKRAAASQARSERPFEIEGEIAAAGGVR
jgi:type IV pilus assembly protein PilM